ncbi:MAG: Ubiquitin-conjugating enzyme E2 B, partial [Paramarteilia canceri]
LMNGNYEGFCAAPKDDNILEWQAYIIGPVNTAFEDGTFKIVLKFSEEYPTKPPDAQFVTEVFHPNIYPDGKICLDLLNKSWISTHHIGSILLSIQSLFDQPNPESPANKTAAELFTKNPTLYRKK